jgi:tetratricopeptide (TPR) repeat protein
MACIWKRTAGAIAAVALLWTMYWSLRLAGAEALSRGGSSREAARAVQLAPFNAEYWLRWADLAAVSGESAPGAFEAAEALNPDHAPVWIRAGLEAEATGDYPRAEYCLLRAARLSRQYEPRWTLAGYYFRRSDAAHFWIWAKSALERSYGNRRPLFDLCWRMTQSPQLILDRAMPPQREVLRDYLLYLLSAHRLESAETVGRMLIETGPVPGDRDCLLFYVNAMLDGNRWDSAVSAWNAIGSIGNRKSRGNAGLTNGDFASEPLQSGLDWRTPVTTGVSAFRQSAPPAFEITFTGREPEWCEVLQQFLSLRPRATYRLSFDYQTSGIAPGTGLQWKVFDPVGGAEVRADSPHLASGQWTNGVTEFAAPPGRPVLLLALSYMRPSGSTLIEGSVRLRNVRLEEVVAKI